MRSPPRPEEGSGKGQTWAQIPKLPCPQTWDCGQFIQLQRGKLAGSHVRGREGMGAVGLAQHPAHLRDGAGPQTCCGAPAPPSGLDLMTLCLGFFISRGDKTIPWRVK